MIYTEEIPRKISSSCWQMAGHVPATDRLKRKINQHQNYSNRALLCVTLKVLITTETGQVVPQHIRCASCLSILRRLITMRYELRVKYYKINFLFVFQFIRTINSPRVNNWQVSNNSNNPCCEGCQVSARISHRIKLIYIHSNEIHNVVALIKCLFILRCQLYMFRTVTVHPQELLLQILYVQTMVRGKKRTTCYGPKHVELTPEYK